MNKRSFLNALLISFMVGGLFVGCNSDKGDGNSDVSNSDSIITAPLIDSALDGLVAKFKKKKATVPFAIEDAFLEQFAEKDGVDANHQLTSENVKMLTKNMSKHALNENLTWLLSEFYFIDSIRRKGRYEAYAETMDLGQTRINEAEALEIIHVSDSQQVLLWHVQYSTYEACPYAAGHYILGTLLTQNQIGETLLLGLKYGAGDPPSSYSETHFAYLDVGSKIRVDVQTIESEDSDTEKPHEVRTKKAFKLKVVGGRFLE